MRPALSGFWTLVDGVSPAEIEPADAQRPAKYEIMPSAQLVVLDERRPRRRHDERAADSIAAAAEREARRLRNQMRKLAASYVFSNLDCTRSALHGR